MRPRRIAFASPRFGVLRATASVLLLVNLITASSASADHLEIGDAPDSAPGQGTTGSSPMNFLVGNLGAPGDLVDVFQINIFDPANFMAEVTSANFNSQLFLFDMAGNGIASNDDGGVGALSRLDATTDAPLALLPAGAYLLGISVYDVDPYIGGSEIFLDVCPTTADSCAPTVAGTFTQWQGFSFISRLAPYTIALNGVNPIPEPSTALLFAAGLVGLGLRRRRGVP